jgi:DNA topoisomerase III
VKRLFIAEKPAMARDIASHMGGKLTKKDGYIEVDLGNGTINMVSSCIGHLLEQVGPDGYDAKYEKFPGEFVDLPILPSIWKLQVADGKSKQVNLLKSLVKQCDEVVNAGDPGREGQLIIDELLEFCGNRKPVKRIMLNSLDAITVKRELNNLQDNNLFKSIYHAGLGRQRADWVVGMNMSRAYTILARQAQYRGVLSVGRVQSPTLAIVVRRDREIENFVPRDYWAIKARIQVAGGEFWARWKKPDPAPAWLDEDGRIIDKMEADRIVKATHGQTGQISHFEQKPGKEEPPLPFSLATLQIFASGRWGYSAQEVLEACQEMYQTHKVLSYPRTDAQHLAVALQVQIPDVLKAVSASDPSLSAIVSKANPSILGKVWDDSKIGEHYALIPTTQSANISALPKIQQDLWTAVAKRYIALFFPDCLVEKATVEATVSQEVFVANGRVVTSPGWREVYAGDPPDPETPDANGKIDEEKDADQLFPPVKVGDAAKDAETKIEQKKTKPPARLTDATLLQAMTNVHQLVKDPQLKQRLKAAKGIGTSATRAAIIENLIRKGLLLREKKTLISSPAARALIDALPPTLIDPALSAMWETALDNISQGKAPLDLFMQKQEAWVKQLVASAQTVKIANLPASPAPTYPQSGKGGGARPQGNPRATAAAPAGSKTCPKCKKGKLVPRQAKAGPNAGKPFLGCTNYPECKHAEPMPAK